MEIINKLKKLLKGGSHADATWRFLFSLTLVTTICCVFGFFSPFWFIDEVCSDRGLFYDCCGEQNNVTSCHTAAWFSEGSVTEGLIAVLVLGLLSILGAIGGSVATIIIFFNGVKFHYLSTRSVFFVGFASGSLMVSSCLLFLQEKGHHSLGTSFYLCLVSGALQMVPILGFMFSKQQIGF
ncbi:uncharacterized protein LOC132562103 [Ylistrum balloti]|uniref:uncharacterized protein LOC132562103 n=1 Tax=Ylistrum balloti TaxID=509963 RepID=UPI00290594FF|nr:uncharacterized protein LOC132562103 [Ylistrum balloti]